MSKRKWRKSSVRVRDLHGLIDCLTVYHGVWCVVFKRFANAAWVQNQQLRVLLIYVGLGYFYYPELTEGGAK